MALQYAPSKQAVLDAVASLKSKTNDGMTSWYAFFSSHFFARLVLGYAGDKINLAAQDKPNVKECLPHCPENEIAFAIGRVVTEMAEKYAFVLWSGPQVKPRVRAVKTNQKDAVRKDVEDALKTKVSMEFVFNEANEMTDAKVLEKLFGAQIATATTPSSPVATTPTTPLSAENKDNATSPTTTTTNVAQPPMRRLQRTGSIKLEANKALAIDEANLTSMLKDVSVSKKRWFFLYYDDAGCCKIKASGEKDSVEEFKMLFNENEMQYVCLKMNLDELYMGEKFIFIVYGGSGLNTIRRGFLLQHKTLVYNFINKQLQVNTDHEVIDLKSLTDDALKQLVGGIKGSVSNAAAQSSGPVILRPRSASVKSLNTTVTQKATTPTTPTSENKNKLGKLLTMKKKKEGDTDAAPDDVAADTPTTPTNRYPFLQEEDKLVEALKDLHSDNSTTNWVMVGYEEKFKIKVVQTGTGGLDEYKPLVSLDQIYFIFYKTTTENTGYGGAPKIVFVYWIGKEVKAVKFGPSNEYRAALLDIASNIFNVAGEYEATLHDELNEKLIRGKITGYVGSAEGEDKNTITTQYVATVKFGGKQQDLKFKDDDAVKNAVKDLHDDSTNTNWIMFTYDGELIQLASTGGEGFAQFSAMLKPTDVSYIFYKVLVQETGYGSSPKTVIIAWVGKDASSHDKARSAAHRMLLREYVNSTMSVAAEIPINSEDELNEASIRSRITGSKGRVEIDGEMRPAYEVQAVSNQQTKKFGGKDLNLKFVDEKAVIDTIAELRKPEATIRWIMFAYDADEKLIILHTGPGGLYKAKEVMDPKQTVYILLRLSVIEYHNVAKGVLATYVPEEAEMFEKAKSAGHRMNLYEYCKKHMSVGGEFAAQTMEELTDNNLVAKIMGGGNTDDAVDPEKSVWDGKKSQVQVRQVIHGESKFQGTAEVDVEFSGKEQVAEALKDLETNDELDYVQFEVTGDNFRDLVLVEKGKDCLSDEWCEKKLTPKGIYIFVVSVASSESGYGMIKKFVFIQWIGFKVKHKHKVVASEIRYSLYKYCNTIMQLTAEMQGCQLPEEVTKDIVLAKVHSSKIRGQEMTLKKKDSKYEGLGKEKKSQLEFADEDAIDAALQELVQDDGPTNWFGVKYKEGTIDVLQFDTKGNGSVDEFKQVLKPTEQYFIVLKLKHAFGYQKDFADKLAKWYYGLLKWQGNDIGLIDKALSSHHWHSFAKMIKRKLTKMQLSVQGSEVHGEVIEEINLERIKKHMRLFD